MSEVTKKQLMVLWKGGWCTCRQRQGYLEIVYRVFICKNDTHLFIRCENIPVDEYSENLIKEMIAIEGMKMF